MKLFLNDSSPYARLVLVVIHEKHLIGEVELVWTDPWSSPPELMAVNPFAKVPALITREGLPLMDSVLICEYLIRIARGPALLADGGAPWLYALRNYAFGRGLIDAAFGVTIQRRFGGAAGPTALAQRWLASVKPALVQLDRENTLLRSADDVDLGDLALGVALGYLDLRLGEVEWRLHAPALAKWFERVAARPSLQLTAPKR